MRRRLASLAVAAALVLVACGGDGGDDDATTGDSAKPVRSQPIRIGAKNFTEQLILGELYRQALVAKGFRVALKANVGSTEIIHRALRRGALDMYPEYIGVLLSEVAELPRPRDSDAAYEVAKRFEQQNGFTLLAQTPGADANALGVLPRFAKRRDLRTIADLKRLKGRVRIGALPEFRTRFEGFKGLRQVYGLRNLEFVNTEQRYAALDSGRVDVASVFTTDAQLAGSKYVVLGDPHGLFASGHVAPIISDAVLVRHGAPLRTAIDAVSKTLTTAAMRKMNAAVDLDARKPADVAREFLVDSGLL